MDKEDNNRSGSNNCCDKAIIVINIINFETRWRYLSVNHILFCNNKTELVIVMFLVSESVVVLRYLQIVHTFCVELVAQWLYYHQI